MKPGTPSQTVGPFFHPSMRWAVAPPDVPMRDDESLVEGTVTDARGEPVPNAVLEIWQPDAVSSSRAALEGFQRVFTGPDGRFAFTIGVPRDRRSVAFAHVTIFSLGLMRPLRTRVYPGASPETLSDIDELRHVPRARLATLVASPGLHPRHYVWPIRLQGAGETVFFAITPAKSAQQAAP